MRYYNYTDLPEEAWRVKGWKQYAVKVIMWVSEKAGLPIECSGDYR